MTFTTHSSIRFAAAAALIAGFFLASIAEAAITTSLDVGDRGADVTALQTYLAADPSLYPEGLVTGYFGSLTAAAVGRFQCKEGIVCSGTAATTGYGRVGPKTMARLNVLMGGGQTGGPDVSAPIIMNVNVSTSTAGALQISWSTNEPSRGAVNYGQTFPTMLERTTSGGTASVGGTLLSSGSTLSTTHTVNVQNLASNSSYYYVISATDAAGNVSFTWPVATTVR